jgi:hypothetical protein
MLRSVWLAFDQLREESFQLDRDDQNVEDSITFFAYLRMQELVDGMAPYSLVHKPLEDEHRTSPFGPSPTPDLGFVYKANPRAVFPIEAKLLRTDSSVSAYVREIQENFLSGRYACFSSEAAMLGYLLSGVPATAFDRISAKMKCPLKNYAPLSDRDHRVSQHTRHTGAEKAEPFRCHHMIVDFSHRA